MCTILTVVKSAMQYPRVTSKLFLSSEKYACRKPNFSLLSPTLSFSKDGKGTWIWHGSEMGSVRFQVGITKKSCSKINENYSVEINLINFIFVQLWDAGTRS